VCGERRAGSRDLVYVRVQVALGAGVVWRRTVQIHWLVSMSPTRQPKTSPIRAAVHDWAAVQLATTAYGLERHLLIRRSTVPNKKDKKTGELVREIAYFLCHTHPGVTLAELVLAAGQRWMVEESFQVAKGQVGLDEHEVRKWCSWYRHTTVCMLAMAFLVTVRSRLIPVPR
jgi:hypothetical protein